MFEKIHDLLNGRERRQLVGIAVMMTIIGIVETGGVASVLPFMRLVSDPGLLTREGWPAEVYDWVGFQSPESALFAAGIALLAVIAVNNAVTAFGIWLIARWGWGLNHRLSTTLLGQYVHQPYSFFLGRNTAELNRTILDEVASVVMGVVLPMLEVAARSISALFIVALLAIVDARLAALVTVTFGGAYAVVYGFLRRSQKRLGQERFLENGRRFRIAGEALVGIKDVKTLGREAEFVRRFAEPSRRFATASARNLTVSRIPRYALETIAFGVIVLIVLTTLQGGSELGQVVPVLALYAFAAYRLMPALNGIFSGVVSIRFNSAALDVLHEDLEAGGQAGDPSPQEGAASGFSGEPDFEGIELRGIGFTYEGASGHTLEGIDMRIQARQVVGFVGPTGAGKTTLVDVMLGLLVPTEGTILVNDVPLDPSSFPVWRQHCGYVPQDVFLADDTVTANIAFGVPATDVDRDAVEKAARIAQIHAFVSGLTEGYETVVGERGVRMSGGQRQRIGIARAMYEDPDVLVLDEATSALDGVTESAVMDTMQNLVRRKTILVIAHRLTTVRACDVIYMLDGGRIVGSGTYDELLRGHRGFQALAGELPS